jgi:hypothetical protein
MSEVKIFAQNLKIVEMLAGLTSSMPTFTLPKKLEVCTHPRRSMLSTDPFEAQD